MTMKILGTLLVPLALAVAGCKAIPAPADMEQARYGKVLSATMLDGAQQRVVVRMGDGSTVDVTQQRDSGIMVGDVVRVFGSGKDARVSRL